MSYQPFPAAPMPPTAAPTAAPPKKGKGLKLLGLLVLIVGLGAGVVAYIVQTGQHEDSVKNLARAVPGFDNTLQFDKTGTFNVYYEYEGTVSANIAGKSTSIPLNGPIDPPSMDATLTDKSGKTVKLSDVSGARYDVAGYKGVAFKTVDIGNAGQFTLSILPKDPKNTTFDLALGKTAIEDPSLLLPILLAAAGLLIGGLLIIAGSRKPSAVTAPLANSPAFGQAPGVYGGYQQPYQSPPPYGGQPYQQPGGYPPAPAPFGGQPTYQQPAYEPTQQFGQQPTYQQPVYEQSTEQYGQQPTYQQPVYEQPSSPHGQPPPAPYSIPNPPPESGQQPPPPPGPGVWGAPESPPPR